MNNRIPIKWIRDRAKGAYEKDDSCFICGVHDELELHHVYSLTNLLVKWAKEMGLALDTDEQVLEIRDEFIKCHHKEIYDDVFTLCSKHHKLLHSVYGQLPPLSTAPKQISWILKQKDKIDGKQNNKLDEQRNTEVKSSSAVDSSSRGFAHFYGPDYNCPAILRKD